MPRQPEGRITKRILDYLRGHGGRWMKIQGSESSHQEAGISDIVGCYRGMFVAIEVKQPGNEPTRLQELFLKDIEKAGGYACVAVGVADVVQLLEKIDAARSGANEALPQNPPPHGRRTSTGDANASGDLQ